jgi:cystathionine beta-lyase/cystathionine gamma-synthase
MSTSKASVTTPSPYEYMGTALSLIFTTPGSMPPDWSPEATTYDLPRHFSEAVFLDSFYAVAKQLYTEQISDPTIIQAKLASCGQPYDYARLGQPLSTLYEWCLAHLSGAEKAVSFASATKAFLSVVEARSNPEQIVVFYCAGTLPLSSIYKQALNNQQVRIFEHVSPEADLHSLYPSEEGQKVLRVYIHTTPFAYAQRKALQDLAVDAVTYPCNEGSMLLIKTTASIDPKAIQIIRKRTLSALLPGNCEIELRNLLNLPSASSEQSGSRVQYAAVKASCAEAIHRLYPEVARDHSAYFCTGLAAEAAVFEAAAQTLSPAGSIAFYYAQNGYGGTGQLIGELLPRKGGIVPSPLTVIDTHDTHNPQTLIDRFIERLQQHQGEPVLLFLETPTNPQLQMHDFEQLIQALKAYQKQYGTTIPVIVDTTMAPLYPLFAQTFAQNWPFLLVKSGSKYFTKGKATLGVVMVNAHPLSLEILQQTLRLGTDADAFAKTDQLQRLQEGLQDLPERMAEIATNTHRIAQYMKAQMQQRGLDFTLYEMNPEQISQGLASGILSFYLPPASPPSSVAESGITDLVDAFVFFMLKHAPEQVKNRVSYGQSGGAVVNGKPQDFIYLINPEESTQGALSQAVKDAQKKDNVQICRLSVPAHCDVDAFTSVLGAFFNETYGAA